MKKSGSKATVKLKATVLKKQTQAGNSKKTSRSQSSLTIRKIGFKGKLNKITNIKPNADGSQASSSDKNKEFNNSVDNSSNNSEYREALKENIKEKAHFILSKITGKTYKIHKFNNSNEKNPRNRRYR